MDILGGGNPTQSNREGETSSKYFNKSVGFFRQVRTCCSYSGPRRRLGPLPSRLPRENDSTLNQIDLMAGSESNLFLTAILFFFLQVTKLSCRNVMSCRDLRK